MASVRTQSNDVVALSLAQKSVVVESAGRPAQCINFARSEGLCKHGKLRYTILEIEIGMNDTYGASGLQSSASTAIHFSKLEDHKDDHK